MSVEINITDQIVEIEVAAGAIIAPVWGGITGTLSNQTDLQNALNLKVPYTGATTNVNLGEFEMKAGQLTLDLTPTGTAAVATTRWNDTNGVSETTLKGGSVVLKNGIDLVARVVNKVTPNATLTKAAYQAVRVSGAQGQRLAVAYAQANNDANSADTLGLVCETIATNQEGFIMAVGQLENINTTGSLQGETWVDGDVLYLSPTTAGAITKVKPTGNGHIIVIGYVEYAHVNNGKIYVKVMNGWELDELHDVSIVTPLNNEALIYETSTALWKNKSIATALGYTPISGTGTAGQVAYFTGATAQTGSNNLFWNSANNRLGIGTNTPSFSLDVNGIAKIQNIIIDGSSLDNTFIGKNNWTLNTGTYNTFIGSGSGNNNTSGYAGTFLGYNSGVANTTGIANTFIGYQSGMVNTTGLGNTFIGVDAGYANVASNYNVIIGFHAGLHADVSENVLIGADTAQTLGFTGLGSVYVGYRTGFSATSANYNTLIGSLAGFSVTTGDNLILIGREAGQGINTGSDTTIIGYRAGFNQTSADSNTMVGSFSGFSNAAGNSNTYIGKESAFYVTTGNSNTICGFRSGYNITTGSDNTFVGAFSGSSVSQLISASNSIAIGYNSFTTQSNQTVIGNSLITHNILFGNLLLGSTTNGTQRLQVTGDTLLRGSGNTFATSGLLIQNSASANIFNFRNDGTQLLSVVAGQSLPVFIIAQRVSATNQNAYIRLLRYGNTDDANQAADFLGFYNASNLTGFRFQNGLGTGGGVTFNFIAAANIVSSNVVTINQTFNPTSGTDTITQLLVSPTINQTGGANGITRGLYVNPTLTAAADWRSIEWSNNTGWGLYGAGTARNYLAGEILVNTLTSVSGYQVAVGGAIYASGNIRFDTGIRDNRDNTIISQSLSSVVSNRVLTIGNGTYLNINFPNGNILIGSTTDSGEKLQVTGTARITGASSFGGNMTLSLNQNATTSITVSNTTSNNFSDVGYIVTSSNGNASFTKASALKTAYKIYLPNDATIYNGTSGDIAILNDFATGNIKFAAGGSSTAHMTIRSNGRINMSSLPTSATGLSAGDLWNDGGTLKIA